jgi:hypothetical protein
MAALDLTATTSYPFIKVVSSVGTTQQEVLLPAGKIKLTVGSSAALYIATSSVSDGAAMPTDKVSIPAANLLELELSHSANDRIAKFAVAAQTSTADVQIILERA